VSEFNKNVMGNKAYSDIFFKISWTQYVKFCWVNSLVDTPSGGLMSPANGMTLGLQRSFIQFAFMEDIFFLVTK
jgi:hypothetical protein